MELHSPFVTNIGVQHLPSHLYSTAKWFDTNNLKPSGNGFDTTLNEYYSNESVFLNECGVGEFVSDIEEKAKEFLEQLGYMTDDWVPKIHRLWLNSMPSGSHHPRHAHYGSCLSGTYYVEIPKGSNEIVFINPNQKDCKPNIPIKNYTVSNSDSWTMYPKEGDLFIWLSDLSHAIPALTFEGLRKSIAFDFTLKKKQNV